MKNKIIMEMTITRERESENQGTAHIFANGNFVASFEDNIVPGGNYGDIINGWGSNISDEQFMVFTATK